VFVTITFWVWARAIIADLLVALGTRPAAAILVTPHIDLYTNNYNPTPGDTFDTYTLPAFTGYAAVAITPTGPVNTGPNTQAMIANAVFTLTATTGGAATVYGIVMSDGAGNFQGAAKFPAPVNLVNPGDFVDVSVALPLFSIPTLAA
jgi:hypothetical protein